MNKTLTVGKPGGQKDPSTSSTTGERDLFCSLPLFGITHLFYSSVFCVLKQEKNINSEYTDSATDCDM